MIYAAQVGAIFQPSATTAVMLAFYHHIEQGFFILKKGI